MEEEELDHICWLIVEEISEAVPFEEKAKRNCKNVKDRKFKEEINYLAGSAESLDSIAEMLYEYDVNVVERAFRYDEGSLEKLEKEKIKNQLKSDWTKEF